MSDIRTATEIEIDGEYRVRVAAANDEFEAAVIATKLSPFGRAFAGMFSSDNDGWCDVSDAPRIYGETKYTAAGRAIDAFAAAEADDEDDEEGGGSR